MSATKRPTVFLDRDGVINIDLDYVYKPEDLAFTKTAAQAISALNRNGCLTIVVTNQSGVARGYFNLDDVSRFHREMNRQLAIHGAHIDAFYVSPYHKDGTVRPFNIDHEDRKPGPGLLLQAMRDWPIDLKRSVLIGDKLSDLEAARRAGIDGILVIKNQCDLEDTVNTWLANMRRTSGNAFNSAG